MKLMRYFIGFILVFLTVTLSAQYRTVDWKTYVNDVIVLGPDSFQVTVDPIDLNDPGAIDRTIGNYFIDFVGHRYTITGSGATTINVVSEERGTGIGPQSGQIARVYQSVGNGEAPFIGGVDMTPLDESARWKKIAADNELFWRQLDSIQAFVNFDNVVIVNKSQPSQYDTTITQAMAGITDASASNTYSIWLMGGDYNVANGEVFPIVMKDYVSIIGFDDDIVRISGSATSLFTFGTEKSSIRDVAITHTPTASGYTFTGSNVSSTAENKIQNCDINYITSTAGVNGGMVNVTSDGLLIIQDCLLVYQNTGTAAVSSPANMMNYAGDLQVFFDTNVLVGYTTQSSGNINIFNNSSTQVTTLSNSDLRFITANASWNDTIVGWRVNASNSVTKFSVNTVTNFTGSGNGAVYGCYSNTGGTSIVDLNTITFKFSNYATEYFAWAESAGDEINGIFANGFADNPTGTGIGGSGTIRKTVIENNNFVTNQTFIDENMRLNINSTNQSINDFFNIISSAGWVSGGAITDNLDGTVDVATGTGLIRVSNDEQADIKMFDFPDSTGITFTENVGTYIYVDYNSGSPIIKTTETKSTVLDNENDKFELYEVIREGTVLHITDHKHRSKNTISLLQQLLYDVATIRRTDGLIIDTTGTRNVSVTSGTVWVKLNKIVIVAVNTSSGGSFDRYYRDGVGGWTKQSSQTQWDNLLYDDGTGTLAAITSNRYSYQDFYTDADGELVSLYGQADYTSQAGAENAPLSGSVPERIDEHAVYIGRIAFQQNTAVGTALSAFSGLDLSASPVSDHNSLSGINGSSPFNHLSTQELTNVQSLGTGSSGDIFNSDGAGGVNVTPRSSINVGDFNDDGTYENNLTFSTGLNRSVNTITTNDNQINHNNLLNTHNLTTDIDHDQLTNYVIGQHRIINDLGTLTTELWSANKISSELATKEEILTFNNGLTRTTNTISTNDSEIDHNALLNYNIANHRVINDASTTSTDLWSANKINSEIGTALALDLQDVTDNTTTNGATFGSPVNVGSGGIKDIGGDLSIGTGTIGIRTNDAATSISPVNFR
jgi:hypothetical protein